jgi:serine/threonine protein phosphatase 1
MLRTKWAKLGVKIKSEHVFAIGDIHGHAAPLEKALETIARTPSAGLPKHLIFLGDTIDRGPNNLKTADLVQNAKTLAGVDKVSILLGNHEIMLYEAMVSPDDYMMFWSTVGGSSVLAELDPEEICYENADLAKLVRKKLPPYLTKDPNLRKSGIRIDDLVFVHAGLSPLMNVDDFLSIRYNDPLPGGLHWAWIRQPFLEWTGGWNAPNPICIIHGHTPITRSLISDTEEIEDLSMLHQTHGRINLNSGAGTKLSQIALGEFLDNGYRVHIFKDENFKL